MDFSKETIAAEIMQLAKFSEQDSDINVLKTVFNLIDLTSLNTSDFDDKIKAMVEKVNRFNEHYSDCPNVAAICVYPNFVNTVKQNLTAKGVKIAAVSAGFPSSQTFLAIKLAETSLAVEKGADDIDIVMSVGKFLNKEYQDVANEIALIKSSCGKSHLKVILETGALPNEESIYNASMLSMEAGADFIKTSTGKQEPAATYEAVYTMVHAIKDYFNKTGRMVGIKPAGGIVTVKQSLVYYSIVKNILGDKWLNNHYFRIGASRLANNLLTRMNELNGIKEEAKYF
ncbi:MAG TPA: deoxyribose-phosphate aldolase [Bacteroidales bacterium]|jgi:deoxyribose-phosphate aldolase|nr:deoxyribose-phosphate aldolase [Bacteroidales bacterium]HNV96541.1 deoxyribose-phosphate aldolase [Bacteroidales bacterium]HOU98419.1 deoxyribose-phosphate aldolase [Bacteroidales bacterium]